LSLPCAGGNKLLLKDGAQQSKPICGKKPPMITSTEPKMGFNLMLKKPGPNVSFIRQKSKFRKKYFLWIKIQICQV